MNNNIISKREFAELFGDPYPPKGFKNDIYGFKESFFDVDNCAQFEEYDDTYQVLVDMFDDKDSLIAEWLYCQRNHRPFTFYSYTVDGDEVKLTAESAEKFYDLLVEIMKERAEGINVYRFV